jgi:transposase
MKTGLVDRTADSKSAGRRRFWSSDEKRRMIAESFAPGASVSKVAQRYGVNANLLFTWRRRDAGSTASGGTEPIELLPVRVEDERAPAAPVEASARVFVGRMEIVLAAGERILVGADVDTAALARVVKALSRR